MIEWKGEMRGMEWLLVGGEINSMRCALAFGYCAVLLIPSVCWVVACFIVHGVCFGSVGSYIGFLACIFFLYFVP